MIITFLRSSSYNSFSICEQQYFCEYVLGIKPPSKRSSDKGNIVHKALEIVANTGICLREGRDGYDDDCVGRVCVDDATPDWALDRAWDYYTSRSPQLSWDPSDQRECRRWVWKAIRFNDGQYNPASMPVIRAEQSFDFTIDADWAAYRYEMPDGTVVDGNLGLKGHIDLVVRDPHDPNIIEIIDWKTGSRKDWSKEGFAKKSYQEIRIDPQLRLYHYAVCRLFPDVEDVFVTIFYINDGGPYSLCFERRDLPETEGLIRRRFEQIRDTQVPFLNVGRKCTTFCHFGTTPSPVDPSKTICEFFKDKVKADGIQRTTATYGIPRAFSRYGSGGGGGNLD